MINVTAPAFRNDEVCMPSCNSARVKRSQYTNRPQMSVFIGSFVSSAIPRQSETSDETKPQNVTDIYIFGPCLLWPNGWMDEDATCYGSRPRPRPHCIRRGPSSPLFSAHVYCGHGRPSQLLRSCYHSNQFKVIPLPSYKKPPQIFCNVGRELMAYGT